MNRLSLSRAPAKGPTAPFDFARPWPRAGHPFWNWLAVVCLAIVLPACEKPPYVWASEVPVQRARAPERDKAIRAGDVVSVAVVGQEELTAQHTVGVDGTISIPGIGMVLLGGKSATEGQKLIQERLSTIYQNPKASLLVLTRSIEIDILGEVSRPGNYPLRSGDGLVTALAAAGGITEFGNPNGVYLIRAAEPVRVRFRLKDLTRGGASATSFELRDGDVIVVE